MTVFEWYHTSYSVHGDDPFRYCYQLSSGAGFKPSLQPFWSPLIFPFLLMVEELYSTRYLSGSFFLINVGSGFHCLRSFSFLWNRSQWWQIQTTWPLHLLHLPHFANISLGVLERTIYGYIGYNGGRPSARLFGWSAADWSRPATNKSISSERKRKGLLFCWERKSWTSWLLTCCSKKGWVAEKSSKKGVNRKKKCFLSSQTRWSWQIKRACTSFWTCSSSPGHWSHDDKLRITWWQVKKGRNSELEGANTRRVLG